MAAPHESPQKPEQPWYKQKWVWAVAAFVVIVVALDGGEGVEKSTTPEAVEPAPADASPAVADVDETDEPEATPTPTKTPTPTPSWRPPADGTWEYGDVSFGAWSDLMGWEYRVQINSPPKITGSNDVTVSSTVHVHREVDRGFGDALSDDLQVWFEPGQRHESNRYNEAYGRADFKCADDHPGEGEQTTCVATFTTKYRGEVKDFHWGIGTKRVGTWPSQMAD